MSDGWDRWARLYRPLEHLVFGGALQRTREAAARLTSEAGAGTWLVVGDGDGRGLAALRACLPDSRFFVVDRSPAMLRRSRLRNPAGANWIRAVLPEQSDRLPDRVDGIVTSFFLDCFPPDELAQVSARLAARLVPGGVWVVADFAHPASLSGWRGRFQRGLLRGLYLAFGWTTPIRARRLPDLDAPFEGWTRVAEWSRGGTRAVAWRKPGGRGRVDRHAGTNPEPRIQERIP